MAYEARAGTRISHAHKMLNEESQNTHKGFRFLIR